MVEAPGFSRGSKVRGSGPCVKTKAKALRFSAGRRRLPQSLSFANDQDPDKNPGRDPARKMKITATNTGSFRENAQESKNVAQILQNSLEGRELTGIPTKPKPSPAPSIACRLISQNAINYQGMSRDFSVPK
jgi:hypothetical protein